MKKLVQTLRNIWSIDDLRSKIIVTLSLTLVYRFGTYIVLPGIDPSKLAALSSAKSGALGMIDAFSGGAFSQASILALGIMPYISASIFMQLATILIPQMQKVQKDGERFYWRWQPCARTRNMWLESNSQNWLQNFPRTRSSLMSTRESPRSWTDLVGKWASPSQIDVPVLRATH